MALSRAEPMRAVETKAAIPPTTYLILRESAGPSVADMPILACFQRAARPPRPRLPKVSVQDLGWASVRPIQSLLTFFSGTPTRSPQGGLPA